MTIMIDLSLLHIIHILLPCLSTNLLDLKHRREKQENIEGLVTDTFFVSFQVLETMKQANSSSQFGHYNWDSNKILIKIDFNWAQSVNLKYSNQGECQLIGVSTLFCK